MSSSNVEKSDCTDPLYCINNISSYVSNKHINTYMYTCSMLCPEVACFLIALLSRD